MRLLFPLALLAGCIGAPPAGVERAGNATEAHEPATPLLRRTCAGTIP